MNALLRFIREEEGISSLEYALIAGLIALAIIGGATALGGAINTQFNQVATAVGGVAPN